MYVCVCVYVYVYVYVLGSTFDVFFGSRLKTQRAPKTKTHTIIWDQKHNTKAQKNDPKAQKNDAKSVSQEFDQKQESPNTAHDKYRYTYVSFLKLDVMYIYVIAI